MKKILSLLLCVVLFLCACSSKKSKEKGVALSGAPFSCTAEISYSDLTLTADLIYRNSANASLKITAPDSLAGLEFKNSDGEMSARYKGLSFPLDMESGSAISLAQYIFTAFRTASLGEIMHTAGGDPYTEGELSSHKYRLTFDKKSGEIKEFTIDSLNFEAEFKNFKNLP